MNIRVFYLPGALALLGAAPTFAGYIADSGRPDVAVLSDATPSLGDTMRVSAGTFRLYRPDGPSDPQIGNDLHRYGWTLDATAVSVMDDRVGYSGTYILFYDEVQDDIFVDADDYRVSRGTASFTVETVLDAGVMKLTVTAGQLLQSQGPELSPPFRDMTYGNPIALAGTILIPTAAPATSQINLTFAAVPEPGVVGVLAASATALLRRKQRR